jgi:hypothetical protein
VDGSHSFAVSLSTNDFDPSLLIASGSYLPFSLGVYGLARDASLDWSHTISLTSVTAFDANGNPLAPGDYSLAFATNAAAADPVPEPGTLSLIGVGVIVPCRNWLRRRRAQRRQSAA